MTDLALEGAAERESRQFVQTVGTFFRLCCDEGRIACRLQPDGIEVRVGEDNGRILSPCAESGASAAEIGVGQDLAERENYRILAIAARGRAVGEYPPHQIAVAVEG